MKNIPLLVTTYLSIRIAALIMNVQSGFIIAAVITTALLLIPESWLKKKATNTTPTGELQVSQQKYQKVMHSIKQGNPENNTQPRPVFEEADQETPQPAQKNNEQTPLIEATAQVPNDNPAQTSNQATKVTPPTPQEESTSNRNGEEGRIKQAKKLKIKWVTIPKPVITAKIRKDEPGENMLVSIEKLAENLKAPIAIVDTGNETKLVITDNQDLDIVKAFKNNFQLPVKTSDN